MKFPYVRYGVFYRPIIPVKLNYQRKHYSYQVLIDTGADLSIIHADVGEILGLEIKKGSKHEFGGVSGRGIGYLHHIGLAIGNATFKNVPISFSYDIAPQSFGILGHEGLFDKIKLIFEFRKKEIEVLPTR